MVRLKLWQWVILATPIASIVAFLTISAGVQIQEWGISWIWAVFTLVFVGWRWLLVRWTKPPIASLDAAVAEVTKELESKANSNASLPEGNEAASRAEAALQGILVAARDDRPIWEDWQTFWQRCQDLVVAIAHIYYPEVKYPLLSIYLPQAYGLIRGTVDDLDRWMQSLSPALNQVTIGQAYQAYEVYRKLEPSARKIGKVWNWAQWILNPATALAKSASQSYTNRADRELLVNFSLLLREAALRRLSAQAIALYGDSKSEKEISFSTTSVLPKNTQTLRDILAQVEPVEEVKQKPVNILLVGRTGSGKSSLINTLFRSELAAVDILPSTDRIQNYRWESESKETLTLWDTPGYEQVKREDFRDLVLDYAKNADLLLLVTPAGDPALQMDVDFLTDMKAEVVDLPAIAAVTQVDRLRPLREWNPPYDWEWGDRPKEISIREATEYRAKVFAELCDFVLPIVTSDSKTNRTAWGDTELSLALIESIDPVKQLRMSRFLRDLEARTVAAAKIIDRYTFQMSTAQGLTALLKSPVLQFISTLSTGSPALAYALAQQIPVEQLPIVIGKLQMAYDLFSLLNENDSNTRNFEMLSLWPLLLENSGTSDRNARAFGLALVEYWSANLTVEQLRERFQKYLTQL